MIATIFNKSKPINLVLVAFIVCIGFFVKQILNLEVIDLSNVIELLLITFLIIYSVFISDFIAKKNALSDQNSFIVLWISLFFILFINGLEDYKLIVSNAFLLLALRKIISLKSELNTTQKIFDAALWIGVSSIFFPGAILYLVILYVSIAMYSSNYYKNWLIPFASLFIVGLVSVTFQLAYWGELQLFNTIKISLPLIQANKEILILLLLGLLGVIGLAMLVPAIKEKTKKNKSSYVLVVISLLIAGVMLFFSPQNSTNALVFGYFPLACLLSVLLERFSTPIQSAILYTIILSIVGISFL